MSVICIVPFTFETRMTLYYNTFPPMKAATSSGVALAHRLNCVCHLHQNIKGSPQKLTLLAQTGL